MLTAAYLNAQFDANLQNTLEDHSDYVRSVHFCPDGKFLASGSWDNTVKIYKNNGTSFELIKTLTDHSRDVYSVRFSPDGKFLTSGSYDNTIKIYEINGTDFKLLKTLTDHSKEVTSIIFSNNGKFMASGSFDKTIKIYKIDGTSFELIKTINNGAEILSLSFSPDGKFLSSGSYSANDVKIYKIDGTNFEHIKTLKDHSKDVNSVRFSSDGKFLSSGSKDNTVKIYEIDGSNFNLIKTIEGKYIYNVNFSPDSKFFICGFAAPKIYEIKGTNFELVKTLPYTGLIFGSSFSSDGNFLALGDADSEVRIYKLEGVGRAINKKLIEKDNNNTVAETSGLPPIIFIDKIEVSEAVLRAGEKINVSITVNNIGLGEAKGVYAKLSTNMDYAVSYKKETKFKIINKTNGTATITIPITAKKNIASSQLQVDIQVIEPVFGMEITGKRLLVATEKLKTPELTLSRFTPKEIISRSPNNQIDINEQIGFDFYIQNVGEGIAESVKVEISNSQTGVMFLGYSKQNGSPSNTVPVFNNIEAGKYELVTAEFFINSSFTDSKIKLKIKVSENKGKYGYTESKYTAVNTTLTDDGEIVIIKPTETTNNNNGIIIEDLPELSNDLISNLPQNPTNKNRYALIIGNENYNQLIAVDYALNDSRAFKIYAEKILGVPADHIIYKENAGIADFNTLITKASNLMNSNRVLYVYYSGHGFPNKDGETYLMPVDVNEDNVSQFGIKLFDFYETLGKNNPAKVTVFIDACFSGGGRNGLAIARSGIKLKPKDTDLNKNIVSFTASMGDEVAQKYDNQQHGLFTYYLLNILKETKGDITYSQLATKLQSEVKDRSNIEKGLKEQNPKISIGSGAKNWESWKIGN